jgi:hypothetical protein
VSSQERKVSSQERNQESKPEAFQDDDNDDTKEFNSYIAATIQSKTNPGGGKPPKPSLFNRINFSKKTSSKTSRPKHRVDPKHRIYKSRLAREPDWDRLPLAQTLYNFRGEMKCDLVFRKGQVIQVMTRTESQNDWWEGKLEGRVGIFPANYVKLM